MLVGGVWGGMSEVRSSPPASRQDSLLLLKFPAGKSVFQELRQDEASLVQATIGGTYKPKLGQYLKQGREGNTGESFEGKGCFVCDLTNLGSSFLLSTSQDP